MPAILTHKYRTFLAQQFVENISSELTKAYIFIGRSSQWTDAANVAVGDSNPSVPVDDPQHIDFDYWRDMLGAKRVTGNTTQLVVPRCDWATGEVYDQYDDLDNSLASKRYYVLDTTTAPFKVYKCVWNNLGAHSTVAPSVIGTALIPTTTGDGYVWQYMYSIGSDNSVFLTERWMPVLADATVQANALTNAGKLPVAVPLVILDAGAGYNAAATVITTIHGDGAGATVTAGVTIIGGAITKITLANGGAGYSQITSINVYQASATTAAQTRAIIPPYPNHGYDPAKELSVSAVMLTCFFAQDETGKLTTGNEFRRVGLLINPNLANGSPANASFYRQTTDITISANTGVLLPDDVVTNVTKPDNPFGTVVDVVHPAANYIVRTTGINDQGLAAPFELNNVIRCIASGVEATVASVSTPEFQWFSGQVVWVNHRTPVTRAAQQIEEIKIVFPFK